MLVNQHGVARARSLAYRKTLTQEELSTGDVTAAVASRIVELIDPDDESVEDAVFAKLREVPLFELRAVLPEEDD